MLWFALGLAIASVLCIVIGLASMQSNNALVTGLLVGGGIALLLFGVPAALPDNVPVAGPWHLFGVALSTIGRYKGIILIILGAILILEGIADFMPGWTRRYGIIPVVDAAATSNPQSGMIGVAAGAAVLFFGILLASIPDVSTKFIELHQQLGNSKDIRITLEPGVTIQQDVSAMAVGEEKRWKEAVEKEAKNQGYELKIDKVYTVTASAPDGKVIKDFVVEFDGTIDNQDPEPDQVLEHRTLKLPSNLDEATTNAWIDDMIRTFPPAPATSSTPAPSNPTRPTLPSGPAVQPPKPNPFGFGKTL